MPILEVLFTPAEFAALPARDLSDAVCVVFDVLRATSTMVTALAHGATEILPVTEVSQALALRAARPDLLLAGERGGRRILARHTGTVDFDLGNSPREFTPERVRGRALAMTTTNGTRALQACRAARACFAASFLNLAATVAAARAQQARQVVVVCSGTGEGPALEDTLAAGAFVAGYAGAAAVELDDSALIARALWPAAAANLLAAGSQSRNARRLLALPELAGDVVYCLRLDELSLVACMEAGGVIRRA